MDGKEKNFECWKKIKYGTNGAVNVDRVKTLTTLGAPNCVRNLFLCVADSWNVSSTCFCQGLCKKYGKKEGEIARDGMYSVWLKEGRM
ncbi:unnamed protein product [Sphenostylis stenocarpa]|uniref:Uncharacterized protein n=1 Tax=Sphenostylis stenocarpa TaxID=92480 RepID=A0AA86S8H2_9FABA|nr:unnamed protein product [Sphenostylis stenocarpa]